MRSVEIPAAIDEQIEAATNDIERGTELLNRTYGTDWPSRIDLDELHMGLPGACVLGQLSGSADAGVKEVMSVTGLPREKVEAGTGLFKDWERYSNGVLNACWRSAIRSR